jgi:hypothetical protein
VADEVHRYSSKKRLLAFWTGLVLAVLGAFGAAWSAGELTRGVWELPEHWWSSMATAPAIVGIVLLISARR